MKQSGVENYRPIVPSSLVMCSSSCSFLDKGLSGQACSGLFLLVKDSIPPTAWQSKERELVLWEPVMTAFLSACILNGHIPKKNTDHGDRE